MTGFDRLSRREKLLIALVIPLALLVALYRFAWMPLQAGEAQARADIAAYRLVQDTAALAAQTKIAPTAPINDTPLATRITSSASAAQLTLRRIEPENDGIRVTLDDTPFATLLLWLADLEEQHDVTLEALEIDRRPAPGVISARLLLGAL
ncbi:type II secretion system protein M [Sulfitobacter sp. W002]|uniref:type II secretion system protein M n=1 Tax=Sulfitobacter sp. W002 TaxID=2867024 RepID=UPI0021A4EF8A|nr:type II secretion system protein M [Sulfitobacter sp. W002]UWR29082.1 type II secretion system protein M [Sulfitobacter sp. W002]